MIEHTLKVIWYIEMDYIIAFGLKLGICNIISRSFSCSYASTTYNYYYDYFLLILEFIQILIFWDA